jgi:hypothetical protein
VAELIVANVRHATSAKPIDATTAKATDVTSTETPNMATAKSAHVAAAAAKSATMPTAAAAATAGLRTGRNEAASKHCACQNHHHSPSHDFLLWNGRTFRAGASSGVGTSRKDERQRRDRLQMGFFACRLH